MPLIAVALVASAMLAGPTLAHHKPGHPTPPGQSKPPKPKPPKPKPPKEGPHDNRGTIKVHEGAGEPSPVMRNQPQVCAFHIHMFKFHADQALSVSIVGHGGNAGSSTYASSVTTDSAGEARVPATGVIADFADGTYKVHVDTGRGGPGRQDKHKVLHVDCADEEGSQPPPPGGGEEDQPPPPGGGDEEQPPPPPGGGEEDNPPNPGDSDQGDSPTPGDSPVSGAPPAAPVPGTRPDTPTDGNAPVAPPKPGQLPDTAMETDTSAWLATAGLTLLLLVATGALVGASRRRVATR